MKILFVARQLVRAGAERQLVTLACALAGDGHEVVVATFRSGDLDKDLHAAAVPLVSLGAPSRWAFPRAVYKLTRLARAMRPDLIHGYLDAPNLLASAVARVARPARAAWALQNSEMAASDMMLLTRALYTIEPRVARSASLIVCNSNVGRRDAIARGFPEESLVVIPQGVDAERFRFDPAQGRAFRVAHGIDPDAIVLARVGRLHPMKDYESFIDAVASVAEREPRVRALCLGTGDENYARTLRAYADERGLGDRVLWCAPTDDMVAAYSASDVLVSSSSYGEGHPTVIAEAMACEVPCVVTDSGDSRDLVGDTGAVVAPKDVTALADAIVDLVSRPTAERRAIGGQGRTRVGNEFSLDALVGRTVDAIRKAIRPPAVGSPTS